MTSVKANTMQQRMTKRPAGRTREWEGQSGRRSTRRRKQGSRVKIDTAVLSDSGLPEHSGRWMKNQATHGTLQEDTVTAQQHCYACACKFKAEWSVEANAQFLDSFMKMPGSKPGAPLRAWVCGVVLMSQVSPEVCSQTRSRLLTTIARSKKQLHKRTRQFSMLEICSGRSDQH